MNEKWKNINADNINLRNLAILMLLVAGGLMVLLIYNMNKTEKILAHSLIQKPMKNILINLDSFFKPVENTLKTTLFHANTGVFDSISPILINNYFTPIIHNFEQISSMGIANTSGYEYNVLLVDNQWTNRELGIDVWGKKERWSTWVFDSINKTCIKATSWEDIVKADPRERSWFINALEKQTISWTKPYMYNTTFEMGMTASAHWKRPNDSLTYIMAFDLTLSDITKFTQNLNVSENGSVFVLTDSRKYIGLPKDKELFTTRSEMQNALLQHPDSVGPSSISEALKFWEHDYNKTENSFEFESNGTYWWAEIMKYHLSEDQFFIVGVIVPETDILSEMLRSKRIVLGSFIFILVLTGFVLYSYGQSRKANVKLEQKNIQISHQKEIIEHAHNEVKASITYAERIQKALLSTDDYWQSVSPYHFILFLPRDVVSGDFFWAYSFSQKPDDICLWAAADCTGHGVPGAFMSMLGVGFLNEIVGEGNETEPDIILNKLRYKIIQSLAQQSGTNKQKDGMDIALCSLNKATKELKYSGAYNPMLLVRLSSDPEPKDYDKKLMNEIYTLYEFKADKKPIGTHQLDGEPFTKQTISVLNGDTIYIFSDGYQDQFGGDKGKKFMFKNLKSLILDIQDVSMENQKAILNDTFFSWIKTGNTKQLDDVCLIGVKIEV